MPQLKFAPKEDALKKPDKTFRFENGKVTSGGETMHVFTDAALAARPVQWEKLHYTADEKDGRPAFGYAASCFSITRRNCFHVREAVMAASTSCWMTVFQVGFPSCSASHWTSIDVQLRTSEHRSMYSYVRLSIDRCTATYV